MALNDTLANALSLILQDEQSGRSTSTITPVSKVIKKVLDVMKSNGYVQDYSEEETSSGSKLIVTLSGSINKCGVIKPRFSASKNGFEQFEKRYLLARNMGILIVSTPQGIMTHEEARKKNTGGKLIAYCY